LNTIINSDKVLVLSNGEVIEYDSPMCWWQMLRANFPNYFRT
jgi:ABC-type multidrug transport system fused ATPase/permease subunit